MPKAIDAQENYSETRKKAASVVEALREMKLGDAAETVDIGIYETLSYFAFPFEHRRRIRKNYRLERLMKGIRRRTRVAGAFPDGQSAVMLVAARLRHVAGTQWTSRKYLNVDLLGELSAEQARAACKRTGSPPFANKAAR